MDKSLIFIVGFAFGSILMTQLSHRYTPIIVGGANGRLDKITGEACVFAKSDWKQETFEYYGISRCD